MPPSSSDPYKYPGTNVLKNIPGIRDEAALQQYEYERTALRADQLRQHSLPVRFDLIHLQSLHKHLFQDVYVWAGDLRMVDISKGGAMFALSHYIESEGRKMSADLAAENNLRDLNKAQFVQRVSHHYGEWNALHPFREGNGRATREFLAQLARGAGYELDQTRIDNRNGQWNEAARRSMSGDLERLEKIFTALVRPARAVAFEQLDEAAALRKYPELSPAIAGLTAIRIALEKRFPDQPASQSKYLSEARSQLIKQLDSGAVPDLTRVDKSPTAPGRER